MTCRWFNIASLVSGIFVAGTVVLWLTTFAISPWDHRLSFTRHYHVGVWSGFSGDTLGRLVFFNNAEYGPYRGSVVSLAGTNHPTTNRSWTVGRYGMGQITDYNGRAEVAVRVQYGDLPGIYIRHIHTLWPKEYPPLWTVMVSLWYPFCTFSILPMWWIIHRWYLRRKHVDTIK